MGGTLTNTLASMPLLNKTGWNFWRSTPSITNNAYIKIPLTSTCKCDKIYLINKGSKINNQ